MTTQTITSRISDSSSMTRKGLNKFLLVFCVGFAFLMGCYWLWATILRLEGPEIYTKDFPQEYVLAKTFIDGSNPYQSLQYMYGKYVPEATYSLLNGGVDRFNLIDTVRPMPHPPTIGVLIFPLGFLNYQAALVTWYIIELLLLWSAVYINLVIHGYFNPSKESIFDPTEDNLIHKFLSKRALATWTITIALFAWQPTVLDIALGQVEIPILFLVSLSLYFLTRSETVECYYPGCILHKFNIYAGIAFGLSLAIKPLALFLIITFLLRKQYTTIAAASATVFAILSVTVMRYGLAPIITYLTDVVPMYSTLYRGYFANFSLLSIPYLLTQNTTISQLFAILLVFLAFIYVLLFHRRERSYAEQYGAACIASVFISPIAWIHYFSLFLPAIFAIPYRQFTVSTYARYGWITIPMFMGFSDFVNIATNAPYLYLIYVSIPFIVYYFTTRSWIVYYTKPQKSHSYPA